MKNFAAFIGLALLAASCGAADDPIHDDQPLARAVPPKDKGGVVDPTRVGRGAIFQGKFFMTYTGTDGRINIMRNDNGWQKQTLDQRTHGGSSLAEFNGRLFLVWIGTDWQLNSLESTDGVSWPDSTHRIFGDPENSANRFSADPAVVVYGGALQVYAARVPNGFFSGTDGNWQVHGALYQYLNFGDGWTPAVGIFHAETELSPSAAVLGQDLVLAWNDRHGETFLTKRFDHVSGWQQENILPGLVEGHLFTANTAQPSLVWVYRVSGGNIGVRQIEFMRTFDGVRFDFLGRSQDTTEARPFGLWANEGVVFFAHVGTDDNHTLNFTPFWF